MANEMSKVDDFTSNDNHHNKNVVVVIFGATGTGKTRVSIELATRFGGEIINSDKIQVYKGLDIVTNKLTDEEAQGIPHHLLGRIDPDEDFTSQDFVYHASREVDSIIQRGRLPIIAGGSNSFLRALLVDNATFGSKYRLCLIWLDVSTPVLQYQLSSGVDKMVERGLVREVQDFFDPSGDYSRGIKRAIGVPEMHEYYKNESSLEDDDASRGKLLEASIDEIKMNTNELANKQSKEIFKLKMDLVEWATYRRIDATEVFMNDDGVKGEECLARYVLEPSVKFVEQFVFKNWSVLVPATTMAAGFNTMHTPIIHIAVNKKNMHACMHA